MEVVVACKWHLSGRWAWSLSLSVPAAVECCYIAARIAVPSAFQPPTASLLGPPALCSTSTVCFVRWQLIELFNGISPITYFFFSVTYQVSWSSDPFTGFTKYILSTGPSWTLVVMTGRQGRRVTRLRFIGAPKVLETGQELRNVARPGSERTSFTNIHMQINVSASPSFICFLCPSFFLIKC